MKRKGLLGWLAFFFFLGVFAALALFIFLYFFKYHVTMMMIDFYFWNKEYDIPLALFSADIKNSGRYESSEVFLSRLYYADVLGYSDEYKKPERGIKSNLGRVVERCLSIHANPQ